MYYASLENCKRLYELSGWLPEDIPIADEDGHVLEISFPRYTAGFLLRRLPHLIEHRYELWIARTAEDTWHAWYTHPPLNRDNTRFGEFADTPEDSLALLAIDLFKEGILQKEVNK